MLKKDYQIKRDNIRIFKNLPVYINISIENFKNEYKRNFDTLENIKEYKVFSVSGIIKIHNNCCSGQIFNNLLELLEIEKYRNKCTNEELKRFYELYFYWKRYHLNDLHCGTLKQENFLFENDKNNFANEYDNICNFLDKNNLLYDREYKFGSEWLLEIIPKNEIENIEKLINSL